MTKEITIGGKQITFTANAATPIYYKQFFKKDLMKYTGVNEQEAAMELVDGDINELAFIMAKQADKADMLKLTFANYLEWLECFNALDLTMKANEIYMVYVADSVPMDEPKKKDAEKRKNNHHCIVPA